MTEINDLFTQATAVADSLTLNTDKSLLNILNASFQNLLKKLNANATVTSVVSAIYGSRLNEETIDTSCTNICGLSVIGWNSFVDSPGDQEINLKSGFK